MTDAKVAQALRAAKLYYTDEMSQSQVAEALGISRPTVAKLLRFARDTSLVTITIHDPSSQTSALATALEQAFPITAATVVIPASNAHKHVLTELAQASTAVIPPLVDDGMRVGISWGNTMYAVSQALAAHPSPRRDVQVVQLKGGTSHSTHSTFDAETLRNVAEAFTARAVPLPLPVIFDDPTTKTIVEQDRFIADILAAGAAVDVAVFTVGDIHREALLLNLGLITEGEITELLSRAVGDACSRFFTIDGQIAVPDIDARTVGITLAQLASRPARVLIAGGVEKAQAISAALSMGLATHLIIDAPTAELVLQTV
ncbi:sugar-binding transcriptional regulator [Corynebacterium choanae]|uniref:Deoxyribonucleoside regulator n=1 Tax=Corynebacterium choanae TaxID=1862358 RepID=A0A3G6J6V6_9CORY|nr:sugar-binding transcriptional regulator [Corynebacterium choanae]AZA12658.1 Deoxyribonucleoside regulator [Corynebacterium choanae]